MKTRTVAILLGCLLVANSLAAPLEYRRPAGFAEFREPMIVAGYRALFTCSAHFFAGRSLDDIKRIELVDTVPFGFPDPVIDESRQMVTASDNDGNRMLAVYRDSMGCTVLPPNWDTSDIPRLPYLPLPDAPDQSARPFPAGDTVNLGPRGLASGYGYLDDIVAAAFDGKTYGDGSVTVAVIVLQHGSMVAERYRDGFGIHSGYRTWSTAKSISAAVLAVAAKQGLLNLNAPADVPEWQFPGDPRASITYKDLLWMSSGLESGGNNTYAVYFGGQDAISAITGTAAEVPPGERWKYANNDTLLYLRALRHVLDNDLRYLRFPYDELLHRLGMYHTRMETDHEGNFIGSSQVYTTARDLARFGLFLAADGKWNGEQLVPEGWVQFSRTAAPTRPQENGKQGYGAQFWLLDRLPGVPENTFTSAGNKGQYVTVVPGHDLVVVRTGVNPNGVSFDQGRLIADIVSAMEDN